MSYIINRRENARYLSDEELAADIARLKGEIEAGTISSDEAERDAYFNDPANAAAVEEQQARMDLVIALHEARVSAGLTQKELAELLGTKQAYIAALEKGKRNITFATLTKYARACGKRVAVTLL